MSQQVESNTMGLLSRAIAFAAAMHDGQVRKGSELPYIVHPIEAAAICATITDDEETIAAAVLHDTVEDTPATIEDLERLFGHRVATIVDGHTENKRVDDDPEDTWKARKQEALDGLVAAEDPAVRIVVLCDKLSNVRAMQRDYARIGERLWDRFNQHDPRMHAWYYRSTVLLLRDELGWSDAWAELRDRVSDLFDRYGCPEFGFAATAVDDVIDPRLHAEEW